MSLGETPMTCFHTWGCMYKGVGRDSGCEHEESHLMHDIKIIPCINCICMDACVPLHVHLGGDQPL